MVIQVATCYILYRIGKSIFKYILEEDNSLSISGNVSGEYEEGDAPMKKDDYCESCGTRNPKRC
jgi:hypothetical protein